MRLRIHYHSDCSFFAGCENMLVNFFHCDELSGIGSLSFSYRFSRAYQQGLEQRVSKSIPMFALPLIEYNQVVCKVAMVVGKGAARAISLMLLLKIWLLLYNTMVLWGCFRKLKDVDLLHINNGGYPGAGSCMAAVFAGRLCGIRKIVYVVNNIATDYQRPARWIDYPFDRLIARFVCRFVTGSAYAGKALGRVLGLSSGKVINVPNGIRLREASESREEFCERHSLPNDRFLIGVIAVLEKRKGHEVLLEAMKLLKERIGQMPLLLIEGDGPERSRLMKYVESNKLHGEVCFVGVEENVFNILNSVDLVILPSISDEDFPNVVIEAMGLGKAVIASRMCGTPEQIDHLENGILVPPGNADALADAMVELIVNPSLRRRLGVNAREKFSREFTADVAVGRYMELYKKLLAG